MPKRWPSEDEVMPSPQIHQRGIGGFDGVLAQKPPGRVLEHVDRDSLSALAHGSDAEIGAVGNQGRQ